MGRTEKKMSTTGKSKTGASRVGASNSGASNSGASLTAPRTGASKSSWRGSVSRSYIQKMRSGTGSRTESASGSYSGSKNSQTGFGNSKIGSKTGSRSRSYSKTGSRSYSKTGSGYTGSGYTQTGYNQTGQIDLEMGQPMMMAVPPQQKQKSGCCCATIVICSILAGIAVGLLGLYKAGYIFQGDSHSAPSDSVTSSSTSAKLSSLRVTSPTATLFKHQKVADGLSEYTKMTTCSVYCTRCIAMFKKAPSDQFERMKKTLKKYLSTKLNMRRVLEKRSESFNHSNFSANSMAKGCLMCNWYPGTKATDVERLDSVKRSPGVGNLAKHW